MPDNLTDAQLGGHLDEVEQLMQSGDKVATIHRVRVLLGIGLKEARDLVETNEAPGSLRQFLASAYSSTGHQSTGGHLPPSSISTIGYDTICKWRDWACQHDDLVS
ncbi:MAG: hypothetical protein RL643_198 [Actinomycetota bacterium]